MSATEDPLRDRPGFLAGFLSAISFFTRLRVYPKARLAPQLAASAWAFPLAGAVVGAVAALVFLISQLAGLGIWPAALFSVLAGVFLTGALHEDGLADTADALFGGHDRDTKLAIMRDSRHGTFGVLAIVFSVALRAGALAAIGDLIHAGLVLFAAHAASRATLPVVMRALVPARSDGLGVAAGKPSLPKVVASVAIGILIALVALGPTRGAVALCLTGLSVFFAARVARRQIGGYSGDILGAIQQVGEIVMLLAASAR